MEKFIGFTVDKITATSPFVNLATAESELKVDNKENKELQELKCQPEVGGDCDILVGLMYSNIFPVAVHSLSNGLTIYKLRKEKHQILLLIQNQRKRKEEIMTIEMKMMLNMNSNAIIALCP